MKQKILITFLIFISSIHFGCEANNKPFIQVGYYEGVPLFSKEGESSFYCYDGEFRLLSDGIEGFFLIFCNDDVSVFLSNSDKQKIIINKSEDRQSITLPNVVHWLITIDGEELYYTSGNEDQEKINIYDVNSGIQEKGIELDYENFWISNNKYYYSFLDRELNRKFYVTDNLRNRGEILLNNDDISFYEGVSLSGGYNYVIGSKKNANNKFIIYDISNNKQTLFESNFDGYKPYFFYENELFFYDSFTLSVLGSYKLE